MVRSVPSRRGSTPMETRRSHMISTSTIRGTLCSTNSPSARSEAAMSLRTEFFAPLTCTVPDSGPPGRRTRRSIPQVSLLMSGAGAPWRVFGLALRGWRAVGVLARGPRLRGLPRLVKTARVARARLPEFLTPRGGLVVEEHRSDRCFVATDGPVEGYVRTVDVRDVDDD